MLGFFFLTYSQNVYNIVLSLNDAHCCNALAWLTETGTEVEKPAVESRLKKNMGLLGDS